MRDVGKRLLQLIPILFVITFLSFAMMHLAGSDAVEQKMLNTGETASAETVERARAELGLNLPFPIQYGRWLKGLVHGDMGVSYVSGKAVMPLFFSKLPATLLLTLLSVLLTVLISVPLGTLSAVYQNGGIDLLIRILSFIGNSMPNFFTALVLMYLLAIIHPIFPVISGDLSLRSAALPSITLAIAMSAKYIRQMRAAVLKELHQPYVTGATARGVRFSTILFHSVLKASLVTIFTLLAMSIGSLLGGTAIVESIFMWDGVGKMAADAIRMRDYPVIQAYVMWMAAIYVLVNLAADLLNRMMDPRIRLGEEA